MKDAEKVRSFFDHDYVSWYMYIENYDANVRLLLYYDFSGCFLIFRDTSGMIRTRSLPSSWITWS